MVNSVNLRFQRWVPLLVSFFLGQGIVQIVGAISGFYLLRWMSVEDYAMFTLAFGVQSLLVNVVDPGFSTAIIPLAGAQASDPAVIGRYMAAALSLRKRFFILGAVGSTGILLVSGVQHGWSGYEIAGLSASLLVAFWTLGRFNVSANALVATQKVGTLHLAQNITAAIRLAGYVTMHLAGLIGGVVVMVWNTVITIIGGHMMARETKQSEGISPEEIREARMEMWRFVMPLLPLTVYTTFQGQVIVLIISIFGDTSALAATGALSRLNQLFAPATFFIGWVVAPYFSKLSKKVVFRRYIQIVSAALLVMISIDVLVWVYPIPLLWLLGPNYSDLEFEVGLNVVTNGFGICALLTYTLIYARKLVGRHLSLALIIGPVVSQILVAPLVDFSTTRGVLLIGLAASIGTFAVSSTVGFVKISRS